MVLDGFRYQDKLLWDVYDQSNDVEEFTSCLCADLGLAGDWASKIAYNIHSQIYTHKKVINIFIIAARIFHCCVQYIIVTVVFVSCFVIKFIFNFHFFIIENILLPFSRMNSFPLQISCHWCVESIVKDVSRFVIRFFCS